MGRGLSEMQRHALRQAASTPREHNDVIPPMLLAIAPDMELPYKQRATDYYLESFDLVQGYYCVRQYTMPQIAAASRCMRRLVNRKLFHKLGFRYYLTEEGLALAVDLLTNG